MPVAPLPADDFVGYLHAYTAQAFDQRELLAEVWDRYHLPESTHTVNRKHRDRAEALKHLARWRADQSPYYLAAHDLVRDGQRTAARYTLARPMAMQLYHSTEHVFFADLAGDGRIASSVSTARMTYHWGEPEEPRWQQGTLPALSTQPPTGPDPTDYLTGFVQLALSPGTALEDLYDRNHTPDAVHYINGTHMQRDAMLQSLQASRKEGLVYEVSLHQVLREANRFAAHCTMLPVRGPRRATEVEVFTFGTYADDGRIQLLRQVMQTASGYWPT
ncbi:nuclear transport factor 2 family protein [Streptomyces flavofungini]|uniref:nuclear transport factor 2 family protein n=1 Tax=Streptomyces flavofungini TaxID=68200 RepID=UPI0025B0F7BA|nr:nuclear transport factor 2 family protein [Streptomyces flavofungini]WJV51694.1 nuclear transport factor 2 family protein [Streptomyces flavofungini]